MFASFIFEKAVLFGTKRSSARCDPHIMSKIVALSIFNDFIASLKSFVCHQRCWSSLSCMFIDRIASLLVSKIWELRNFVSSIFWFVLFLGFSRQQVFFWRKKMSNTNKLSMVLISPKDFRSTFFWSLLKVVENCRIFATNRFEH